VKQLLKRNIEYAELDESAILARERAYLSREFGCEIGINEEYDPTGKRTFAIPLKPAIYVAG
jgi:hypothetical protein